MTAQALIFTHVAHVPAREDLHDPSKLQKFVQRHQPFFEACLRCPSVGIVFVYSSYGVEFFVQALQATKEPQLPLHVLDVEQHIYDAIQQAIDMAVMTTGISGGPKFVVIGIRELASHLLRLQRMDPRLVRSLATKKGTFTYDSPKYVEAILRLARAHAHLPPDPIVRIDIDVEPNEEALRKLLDYADECARNFRLRWFWWFSGCYFGNGPDDPVNEHAVRQHWLVEKKPGTVNQYVLPEKAKSFLVDIAELGATQLTPERVVAENRALSPAAEDVVRRRGWSNKRRKPQVISGAGLIASAAAIRRLPPFMNAPEMVVWIDDYLKRRLHEAIEDIDVDALERVDAAMKQDRFPKGIPDDTERTHEYFRRLLNGCLFDAAIGVPEFTSAIRAIVDDKSAPITPAELAPVIEEAVRGRYHDARTIWSKADYGRNLLRAWARRLTAADEDAFCTGTVKACLEYLKLCALWPKHVQAITQLQPDEAYWLFTQARREPSAAVPGATTDAMVSATTAMMAATEAMAAATDAMLSGRTVA